MERCSNCKHCHSMDILTFCDINHQDIVFPFFMGGSKKCECYEKVDKNDCKFIYPKKKDMKEGHR